MKRFITATLTLALITGLSSGKACAQQANDQQGIWNDITFNCHATPDAQGLIAIIALAATEVGIIAPSDCPQLGGQEGEDIVCASFAGVATHPWDRPDGWDLDPDVIAPPDYSAGQEAVDIVDLCFELVDAGYTEDEAFDLIELVIGDHNALGFEGESVSTLTSYEGKLPIAEPLPERLPVKSYQDIVNYEHSGLD